MPSLTSFALTKKVKDGEIDKLYYLYGHDVGSLEATVKWLVRRLSPEDAQIMNLHKFDGRVLDVPAFADACEAIPMFADRVVAVINDLNIDKLVKEDTDALRKIVSDLPETTTVIIYTTGEDVYKNKRNLTDKNKRFCEFCGKHGITCDFAYKKPEDMGKTILSSVEKHGCKISMSDSVYLANLCLSDSALVRNEIAKLTAYANGGTISRKDIDSLCSRKIESDGFTLALSILLCNANMVFHRIDELAAQEYVPIEILGTISFSMTDIYRAKLARASGKTVSQVIEDFKYPAMRKFAVENAYRDCGKISGERMRKTLEILSQTDLRLKTKSSGKEGDFLVLEQGITRAMALRC